MKRSPLVTEALALHRGQHVIVNIDPEWPQARDDGTPIEAGDIHVDGNDGSVYEAVESLSSGFRKWIETQPTLGLTKFLAGHDKTIHDRVEKVYYK